VTDILESLTDFVIEPGGERSSSDTGSVSLNNSNLSLKSRWWDTKSSADTTDTSAGGCTVRPGSEIDIEHSSVSSFSDDSLGGVVKVFTNKVNRVDKHFVFGSIELLGELMEFIKFLCAVKLRDVELVLESINERVVLLLEESPVSEITSAESNSEGLGSVSWTNTAFCCANHCRLILFESTIFFHTISQDLDIGD